ncbi:TrmB family transcriptional regulator [Halorubellus sp. JP-L1]|uniref:TrmB family transcriptional regulator n=1 Tax=Halorubellus sp. JP-L1 TaxID=2715753 RepID=UPI00140D077D|nr:TrmB family transcriptional regulator [Halorubellus sp. JP-L1]NHN42028.1 TrmB family transcriptional regulator [Halorubellus sp. JP-L1]
MSTNDALEEAVDVLQELGLKEYEAKCFAGLARLPRGTAKQLSEITEVPRTRVYDAIRVLEAQGLVEVQHKSPQEFRAVSLEEAMETLRDRYESRVQRLADALGNVEQIEADDKDDPVQEVWSLSGSGAIASRTERLLVDARDEVVLVVGDESVLTTELVATLTELDDDVDVIIGAVSHEVEQAVADRLPRAETFVSGLEWLHAVDAEAAETAIGRLLLVDRGAILVSTLVPESGEEHAVFGTGFGNGLVVISRRLMAQGLLPASDPADP